HGAFLILVLSEWAQPKISPNAHELASEMQIAPRRPASNKPIAIITPTYLSFCHNASDACAASLISTPINTVPVSTTMKTATMIVTHAPSQVSTRPQGISFSVMPLSTTDDCWKNSIQGAMVVPILAIRKKNKSPLKPPGKFGTSPSFMICATDGCTRNAAGMQIRLRKQNARAIFSHVQ